MLVSRMLCQLVRTEDLSQEEITNRSILNPIAKPPNGTTRPNAISRLEQYF